MPLLALMVAGGVTSALINNSSGEIENSCKNYNDAIKNFQQETKQWTGLVQRANKDAQKVKDANGTLASNISDYKIQLNYLRDHFRKKFNINLIGLSIFVFIMMLSLLLKYFKVIPNIWNFIVNKK